MYYPCPEYPFCVQIEVAFVAARIDSGYARLKILMGGSLGGACLRSRSFYYSHFVANAAAMRMMIIRLPPPPPPPRAVTFLPRNSQGTISRWLAGPLIRRWCTRHALQGLGKKYSELTFLCWNLIKMSVDFHLKLVKKIIWHFGQSAAATALQICGILTSAEQLSC